MSGQEDYWQIPTEHSRVKSDIVVKYFMAWSKVLSKTNSELIYLDLCAGQARHDNGEFSTGLRIVQEASVVPYLQEKLKIILNDMDKDKYISLVTAIDELKLATGFRIKPTITNEEVNASLASQLQGVKFLPTFCFIDPYGYKGITIDLIKAVIKGFGCDCILFFHTKGINRNLTKEECWHDLRLLFGEERFKRLLGRVNYDDEKRFTIIIDEFCEACKSIGASYVQPFQFNIPKSSAASHHLIFLSKHERGFNIIKKIMDKFSLKKDGMTAFIYVEGCANAADQLSFENMGPMSDLKERIVTDFAGTQVAVKDVIIFYDGQGAAYTVKDLKNAIASLEADGVISIDEMPGRKRRPGTLGDNRIVHFRKDK